MSRSNSAGSGKTATNRATPKAAAKATAKVATKSTTAPARGRTQSEPANGVDPVMARGEGSITAYHQLRDRIVRGRLPPGARLVEREVAARLGVSRTPVRAALERLRQEGFIVGAGGTILTRATVAPLTTEDARSIYQIVALIEGLAAHEAATKPHATRIEMTRHMRDVNTQFRSAALVRLPDPDELHDLDDAFHNSYVHVGASGRLRTLHDAVKPQAERYGRIYTSTLASEVATSAAEHDVIVKALEEGDPGAAQRAVQTNWENAATRLARVISAVGERGTW
ncbi:MAG: GntR family transcriptional regulator [Gemmatimonadota bacterium]|nr:GntR family transcriptional regulator [Gemmatimonadota bacterium]